MLKQGEKCLCKKSIYRFEKGNSYYITWSSNSDVILRSIVNDVAFDEIFCVYKYTNYYFYFYDYFYSENEERKLKLENINNVR